MNQVIYSASSGFTGFEIDRGGAPNAASVMEPKAAHHSAGYAAA